MRGLYITLIIFLALLSIGILNYIYIGNVYSEMVSLTEALEEKASEENNQTIKELQEYWNKKSSLIGASISYTIINKINDLIDSLEIYNNEKNDALFLSTRRSLKNAIEEIKRLEDFSLKNIL